MYFIVLAANWFSRLGDLVLALIGTAARLSTPENGCGQHGRSEECGNYMCESRKIATTKMQLAIPAKKKPLSEFILAVSQSRYLVS